jgi:hypothetical protein
MDKLTVETTFFRSKPVHFPEEVTAEPFFRNKQGYGTIEKPSIWNECTASVTIGARGYATNGILCG